MVYFDCTSCLSRSRKLQDARPYKVPDLLELQASSGPVEARCQNRAGLVVQPFDLRKLQGILQRAFLGIVQDQHREIPLVHSNVANTEIWKQGFGCL